MPDIIYHIASPDGSERQANAAGIAGEISNGTITVDTPLWREGWAEWRMCGTLPEFQHLFKPAAVPPPSPYRTPPPPRTGKYDTWKRVLIWAIVGFGIFSIGYFGCAVKKLDSISPVLKGGVTNLSLADAVCNNDLPRVIALLNKGADANAVLKVNGMDMPMLACALIKDNVDETIVKALLDAGANANAVVRRDGDELPMLACALVKDNVDETNVKALLDAGANANAVMRRDGDELPMLYAAITKKDASSLKILLDAGADANLRLGNRARTPLMIACTVGGEACVKVLLQAGANIYAKDNEGYTALMIAEAWGEEACARLIRDAASRQR